MSIIADRPGSSSLKEGKPFFPSQNPRREKKVSASVFSKLEECKGDDNSLAAPLHRRNVLSSRAPEQGVGSLADRRQPGRGQKPVSCAPGHRGSSALPGSLQSSADMGLACIKSHIITKNPYIPLYDNRTDIEFYPGMIKFRRQNKEKDWQSRTRPNRQNAMSKRGEIKGFSKKSRSNFLQLFGKIEGKVELWIDLTFHDQVLKDKTQKEKAVFSSEKIRVFLQWFKRNYPHAWLIWKREWQARKSGILQGNPCPHLHTFLGWITEEEKNEILEKWVEITGVQGEYRIEALQVAFHRKSWRWVKSASEAQKYATKYGSKATEATGRSWGKVGPVPIAEPKKLQLTAYQQVLLRKILRGWAKRSQKKLTRKDRLFKKYQLTNRLRRNDFQGFILIPGLELIRIIEYIRQQTGGYYSKVQ